MKVIKKYDKNMYDCSNGEKVSETTIDRRRSEAYKKTYGTQPIQTCQGCGKVRAQGSSHIISQKRCKHLHKTELIWTRFNFFPACHNCNSRWESNDTTLLNYEVCLQIVKLYDKEGYLIRTELIKT